jgi:sulfatase modifying factor 1
MTPGTIPSLAAASPLTGETSAWRNQLAKEAHAVESEAARRRLAVNAKDGSILVRIPAGVFEMGDGKDSDCPTHRVEMSEYWIGMYCVTNRQYGKFVAGTKCRVPDNQRWQQEELSDHPVTGVSWDDCAAYAEWAGLSLPTEAQWEKATRGPGGLIYPWGNDWDAKKCRNSTNKGSGRTAAVWEYPHGTSGYGTLQQSGNVWEWCADWYDEGYYEKSPAKDPDGPQGGSFRVYRGGSEGFRDAPLFRGADRRRGDPANRTDGRGFRLVRNCT